MKILRTTTTRTGISVSELEYPPDHLKFTYDSPSLGNFRGDIEPLAGAGWTVTVYNPGRNIIPTMDKRETKNLNDAVNVVENHIKTLEKTHQDKIDMETKQDHQHKREIHSLFTPKD